MSLTHHYIQTAAVLLQGYKGEMPFPNVLKQYFAQHKKYGSRDRRIISQICYAYFRLGKALLHLSVEERILVALFFCSSESNAILKNLQPEWDAAVAKSFAEKQAISGYTFSIQDIFPWQGDLSEEINNELFTLSHLQQPLLFLRVRPSYKAKVAAKLEQANISFELTDDTIALANASKVDAVLQVNKEVVVQDKSSQQTGKVIDKILQPALSGLNKISFWDACAASGGKSIMLYDLFKNLNITVSDIRPSILANLKSRFSQAGIRIQHSFIADLTLPQTNTPLHTYDLILTDVPCTGSGTWARTPEQLYYFDEKTIPAFAQKQLAIASNAAKHLKPGGWLVYITCSVFKKENEAVVTQLMATGKYQLCHSETIFGYTHQADNMYIAILQNR